jgi:hypothetical protein
MTWPFRPAADTRYWLRVFALYTLVEACIQLLFLIILNNFGTQRISIPEYHVVMLFFQCLLIWPIWWVAWQVRKKKIIVQVLVNLAFYAVYSVVWFGPVQDAISFFYNQLQEITRPVNDRQAPYLDRGYEYSFLNYQLLKHAFRLSWFYLADYFYNHRAEETKKIELAVSNRELQLKLLKWHLNPSFYFKTIHYLRESAAVSPSHATAPILQLAKVMEYVIYDAREPLIEMKRELEFLHNYTDLLERQSGGDIQVELEYGAGYEKCKIAPLLLTGLLDSIISTNRMEKQHYRIRADFTGCVMEFSVNGVKQQPEPPPLLDQLYATKHSLRYGEPHLLTLNLKLDEC